MTRSRTIPNPAPSDIPQDKRGEAASASDSAQAIRHNLPTLDKLEQHVLTIPLNSEGSRVAELFAVNPNCPGLAVIAKDGSLTGLLSRQTFRDLMLRPYGKDLYLKRGIGKMADGKPLVIPHDTPIDQAAAAALERDGRNLAEPLVIRKEDGSFAVLDLQVLLRELTASLTQENQRTQFLLREVRNFAGQLGEAMQQVDSHRSQLLAEIQAAKGMQLDLLPRLDALRPAFDQMGLSVDAMFEPCIGIGGDLWGCMDCGQGRMAFFCFDFAGHGVGAAMNVFRLHTLLADHWSPALRPDEVLTRLNLALTEMLRVGQYATMIFAVIDSQRDEISWSAAGAPAPVLLTGQDLSFLDSRGVPLGISKSIRYSLLTAPFPKGSSLLLYSDAVTEAQTGSPEDMIGEDGLTELVQLARGPDNRISIAALTAELFRRAPPPLADDLTCVAIHRAG